MRPHIRLLVVFLFIILAQKAYSTAQIPDKLIYKGKIYELFCNPLEVSSKNLIIDCQKIG